MRLAATSSLALAIFAGTPMLAAQSPSVYGGFASLGEEAGRSNILVTDVLGPTEIYVDCWYPGIPDDAAYWVAMSWDSIAQDYRQVHVSERYSEQIVGIEIGKLVSGPAHQLVVLLRDGTVVAHDLATRRVLGSLSTGVQDAAALALHDLDGDGIDEIAFCSTFDTLVYDATGTQLHRFFFVGGKDIVIGQMDPDPSLEIAVTDGVVIDWDTRTYQCSVGSQFGIEMALDDIDADGMEELIFIEFWSYCIAFDVDICQPKWTILRNSSFDALALADVNGDGRKEAILGESYGGEIYAYDTVTQAQVWWMNNPEFGCTGIAAADVDGDSATEVLWGASDQLFVGDWVTAQAEWESAQVSGPFRGPYNGDLDGDGVDEIVSASRMSESFDRGGRILVFDQDMELIAMSDPVSVNANAEELHGINLRDIDSDGDMEVLVGTGQSSDGVIEIYNYSAGSLNLVWTNSVRPQSVEFRCVDAADVDLDGFMEVVGGVGRESASAAGEFIYVYNMATGTEEWHSPQLGPVASEITELEIRDIDADPSPEIIGMVKDGAAYVFDGVTKNLEATIPGAWTCMRAFAAAGGRPAMLALGTDTGWIYTYSDLGSGMQNTGFYQVGPGRIDGFTVGFDLLFVGVEGRLIVHPLPPGGPAIWTSEYVSAPFGSRVAWAGPGRFVSAGYHAILGLDAF